MKAKILFSALILFLNSIFLLAADPGSISGRVLDKVSGEGLPGANVFIEGTAFGTATGLDGSFTLAKIPAGEYELSIRYIGYSIQTVTINIEDGETLIQDIELVEDVVGIDEVVVTAQLSGQRGAINRQLTANSVMNAVSKDKLQELPDANIAESLGRIPGVSVGRSAGEANKIIIRGLEPKMNAVTVNGVRMPSTSSGGTGGNHGSRYGNDDNIGDRSVDLSMISGDLLEAVEVYKATTPDMDAEAIGGMVNLRVKKAGEKPGGMLRIEGGYNQLASDFSNYKAVGQYSRRFFNNKFGVIAGGNIESVNRSSERLSTSWSVDGVRDSISGEVPIRGRNLNARYTEETRKRYGASLTLDYKYDKGVIWLSNFYTQTSRDIFSNTTLYSDETGNIRHRVRDRNVDMSGLSSSLNGEHRVKNMDIDWVVSRFHTQTDNWHDWQLEFHEDGGQPYDSTLIPGKPLTWPGAARNDLDYMYLRNVFNRPDTTSQTDYSAELNLQIPFALGNKIGGFLKFGGKYTRTDRDRGAGGHGQLFYYLGGDRVSIPQSLYPEELIINDYAGRISARNFITSPTDSKQIINNEYSLWPIFDREPIDLWYETQQSDFRQDRYELANVYNLTETIAAGYMMAKLNMGQVLTIIPGVRYEYSDNIYNAVWSTASEQYGAGGTQKDTTTTKTYGHWFPHLHMQLKPLSWFDLRASVNKTLARPNYDWISPRTQITPNDTRIIRGNPHLVESTSWNYELAAAFHHHKYGLLSIGGFYKDISNIFYVKESRVVDSTEMAMLQIPGGGRGYLMNSFANSDNATLWGFEIDLQAQFSQMTSLPNFLRGIVLNVNYTRVWSETAFSDYDYKQVFDYTTWPTTVSIEYTESERRGTMPGQSAHVFNISLGYDIGGFSARASVMYQGRSLSQVGTIPENDSWNDDFWRFDASLKYRLKKVVSFYANFMNISGQPDRGFFGNEIYQTNLYYYGMTANLGVQFDF